MTDKDNTTLIFIPKNANYIEILGHRIDDFDSFEAFCEHLKKYAELEEMVERQKKEIEARKYYYDECLKDLKKANAENERLKNAYKQCAWERDIFQEGMKEEIKKECSYLQLDINTIKIEAYKEFANELKCRTHEISCNTAQVVTRCDIDNLLKDLVGEDNV